LGRGLTLDDPSHGFQLIRVTEELVILPVIEEEIRALSSFWFLVGCREGPVMGVSSRGRFPKLLIPWDELISVYSLDDCGG
jgi:hypothetical protein